jgi:hypothetical protein
LNGRDSQCADAGARDSIVFPSRCAQARAAIGSKLGEEVTSFVITGYKTQVVRASLLARAEKEAPLNTTFRPPPPLPPQVAGLKYKVAATVNGKAVVITAFKPLPHTGNPMEVQGVEVDGAL